MAWEELNFTDGEILYADSHMNPLQNNFTALAQQDSGAPKIDVSSFGGLSVESATIDTLFVNSSILRYAGKTFYACRAWVNFDGTGTPSVRASGNVTDITDLGTGSYRINLTLSMVDTDYCINATAGDSASAVNVLASASVYGISNVRVHTLDPTTGLGVDAEFVNVSLFR